MAVKELAEHNYDYAKALKADAENNALCFVLSGDSVSVRCSHIDAQQAKMFYMRFI